MRQVAIPVSYLMPLSVADNPAYRAHVDFVHSMLDNGFDSIRVDGPAFDLFCTVADLAPGVPLVASPGDVDMGYVAVNESRGYSYSLNTSSESTAVALYIERTRAN